MTSATDRAVQPIRTEGGARRIPHASLFISEILILVPLLVLALVVKRHPGPLTGDVGFELDVQKALLPHHSISQGVEAISTLGWPIPSVITLAVIALIFFILRRWLDIIVVILTGAVTDETSYLFNQWVTRPRPHGYGIYILAAIHNSFSFPSGHVVHTTAIFGLFLFLTTQIQRPIHDLLVWVVRLLLIAGLVLMPVSRVLEGEHWPTDALAGLLFGLFWLVIAAHTYLWARARWPRLLAPDER